MRKSTTPTGPITDRHAQLLRFLADMHAPPLKALEAAMEEVLNSELLAKQFENGHLDLERVRSLLAECQATKVPLDSGALAYAYTGHLEQLSDRFAQSPEDAEVLESFATSADLVHSLPLLA